MSRTGCARAARGEYESTEQGARQRVRQGLWQGVWEGVRPSVADEFAGTLQCTGWTSASAVATALSWHVLCDDADAASQ